MSSSAVNELIAEYALGSLDDPAEIARAEELLASDASNARQLSELQATLELLSHALAPEPPSRELRGRLLASSRGGRFAQFAGRFARIFDVTVDRAKELLDWIDDPSKWEQGPGEGTALIHFPAGPACAGADTGFVRVEPGAMFPWHAHAGEETNLVLQGACIDHDGTRYARGDEFVSPRAEHDFCAVADTGVPYVFAVRVFGVSFDVIKPDDA